LLQMISHNLRCKHCELVNPFSGIRKDIRREPEESSVLTSTLSSNPEFATFSPRRN
jgi:hypothetical protein